MLYFTKFTFCKSQMSTYYSTMKRSKQSFIFRLKGEQKTTEYIKDTEDFLKRVKQEKPQDFFESLGSMVEEASFAYQTIEERLLNVRVINRRWISGSLYKDLKSGQIKDDE